MENKFTKTLIFLLLISILFAGNAQENYDYYLLQQSFTSNAAAKCWQEGSFLSASFLNKFCKKEMLVETLDIHHVHRKNCITGDISHSGYARFGELTARIGYGRAFGQRFSAALQAVYILNHAEHYAAVHSFTINLSAFCKVTDKCDIAVEMENPIHLRYGVVGGDLIPMSIDVRLHYAPRRHVHAYAFFHKTLPGELDIGAGGIWQAHRHLLLGMAASSTNLQAGIHIPFSKTVTAIVCQWHFHTGFSPQCSITIQL